LQRHDHARLHVDESSSKRGHPNAVGPRFQGACYDRPAMMELLAAGAALAGRALLQAADAAILALGEDEVRAHVAAAPQQARRLLRLKKQPEPTAASLRGASSALLAFAAVACAIVAGDVLFKAGIHANS